MSGGYEQNYYVQRGDTTPPLVLYLEDRHGNVPDFDGRQVRVSMWKRHSEDFVFERAEGDVLDEAQGKVAYEWAPGDTDEEGTYKVQVKLITPGDPEGVETFPAVGAMTVQITNAKGSV